MIKKFIWTLLTIFLSGVAAGYGVAHAQGDPKIQTGSGYISIPLGVTGDNTTYGSGAGAALTTGVNNTLIGKRSGESITDANANTTVGYGSGGLITGAYNTVFGTVAGKKITTGQNNSVFGWNAAALLTTGSHNVYLGNYNATASPTADQQIYISDGLGNIALHADMASTPKTVDIPVALSALGGAANAAVCWKADAKTLGYCSSVVGAGGTCTCN